MKNTKKSFIMSLLSLVLCFAMLIGTTYAWFTDSVTSGKNKIVAGNLDVDLLHWNSKVTTPTSVEGATDLFSTDLWEPGKVVYENFKVSNEGTLALKYKFALDAYDYNTVTRDETEYNLLNKLKVLILNDETFSGTREEAINKFENADDADIKLLTDFNDTGWLMPKGKSATVDSKTVTDSKNFAVLVYWEPADDDNLYNVNNDASVNTSVKGVTKAAANNALFVDLGINLIATQKDQEADSFDQYYDWAAEYPVIESASASVSVQSRKAEVTLLVAPEQGESTKVSFTDLPENVTKIKVDEEIHDILASNATYQINAENAAAASVDLSLYVNEQTAATVDGFNAKVETYVAKNMKNVTINYADDAAKTFGANNAGHKKSTEAEVTSTGDYYYDEATGRLVFLTDHFSEYVVGTTSDAYIAYFGNKAKEVRMAYDTVKDALDAIETCGIDSVTTQNTGIYLLNNCSYTASKAITFVTTNNYNLTIDCGTKWQVDVTERSSQNKYEISTKKDYECRIGDTKFEKLADAFKNTTLEGDIVLLRDIEYRSSYFIYGDNSLAHSEDEDEVADNAVTPRTNIVIDLNGYSLASKASNTPIIKLKNTSLTIKDSSESNTGSIKGIGVYNDGSSYGTETVLNLDGVNLSTDSQLLYVLCGTVRPATINVKDSNITVNNNGAFAWAGAQETHTFNVNLESGSLTINQGGYGFVVKSGTQYGTANVTKTSGFTVTGSGTLCDKQGFSITDK